MTQATSLLGLYGTALFCQAANATEGAPDARCRTDGQLRGPARPSREVRAPARWYSSSFDPAPAHLDLTLDLAGPARVSASQVAEGVCPPVHPDHAHAAATGREHILELCGIPSTRRATDFDQNQGLHVNYVFD